MEMASPSTAPNCAQDVALDLDQDNEQVVSRPAKPCSATPEYDFVEQPSQDYFCPVMMELLMEPQLTSCCGHHLSAEASSRLKRDGRACPMCNEQQWSAMLDKFHRRKIHELRVRCLHKCSGCDWEGEVASAEGHAASCSKRPWECPHCALSCTYENGEGKHWPACSKFPEPCPNGCEVGNVERCHLEQHHRECPLEPVACEMRGFGCSAVVPRKDLTTHMRESELQHLTAMAVLNLRLTRQLQQDAAEKDEKIAQLQMEMNKQKEEFKKEMKKELAKVNEGVEKLSAIAHHIAIHTAGICGPSKTFIFSKYKERKGKDLHVYSDEFYSHECGYKFKLLIKYYQLSNDIGVFLCLDAGEYDDQLPWPVKIKVCLEMLNQAGNHQHVQRSMTMVWRKEMGSCKEIDDSLMKYANLERSCKGVQYIVNDCVKFRLSLAVLAA